MIGNQKVIYLNLSVEEAKLSIKDIAKIKLIKNKLISQLEKEITLRYLKTRKEDGFKCYFFLFGISLSPVLIIVMSVINGFRQN